MTATSRNSINPDEQFKRLVIEALNSRRNKLIRNRLADHDDKQFLFYVKEASWEWAECALDSTEAECYPKKYEGPETEAEMVLITMLRKGIFKALNSKRDALIHSSVAKNREMFCSCVEAAALDWGKGCFSNVDSM